MGLFSRIRDKSDYQIKIKQGRGKKWRWMIVDADGKLLAVCSVTDAHLSSPLALVSARAFIKGLGADPHDLKVIRVRP